MRVVINQRLVQRNRKIAQYAFFATLALLILGLFVTNAAPANPALLLAPLLVLPIAIIATMYSVRMANNWLRQPRPEEAMEQGLKGLGSRSVIYHYWMPAKHVLIAPQGVFTFTTRPQEGRFRVEGDRVKRAGGFFGKLLIYFRQDTLGDPHREALKEAAKMQALIDQVAPDSGITVQPAIVFTSPAAVVEVVEPSIPVVHAETKKRPSLKSFLREAKKQGETTTLSEEQIKALERAAKIPPQDAE